MEFEFGFSEAVYDVPLPNERLVTAPVGCDDFGIAKAAVSDGLRRAGASAAFGCFRLPLYLEFGSLPGFI